MWSEQVCNISQQFADVFKNVEDNDFEQLFIDNLTIDEMDRVDCLLFCNVPLASHSEGESPELDTDGLNKYIYHGLYLYYPIQFLQLAMIAAKHSDKLAQIWEQKVSELIHI